MGPPAATNAWETPVVEVGAAPGLICISSHKADAVPCTGAGDFPELVRNTVF